MIDRRIFGPVPVFYADAPLDEPSAMFCEPERGVIGLRSKGVQLLTHLTSEQAAALGFALVVAAETGGADIEAARAMLTGRALELLERFGRVEPAEITAPSTRDVGHA